jgi:hypothetical protein
VAGNAGCKLVVHTTSTTTAASAPDTGGKHLLEVVIIR